MNCPPRSGGYLPREWEKTMCINKTAFYVLDWTVLQLWKFCMKTVYPGVLFSSVAICYTLPTSVLVFCLHLLLLKSWHIFMPTAYYESHIRVLLIFNVLGKWKIIVHLVFIFYIWPEIGTNQSTESTERRVYHMITCKLISDLGIEF